MLKTHLGDNFAGSLLDVGSGYGFFLKEVQSAGWRAIGIESSPREVRYSTDELHVEVLDSDVHTALAKLPSSSFDAVTFWHVLEHVEQPRTVLEESKRLLRPGGLLVVNSPNLDSAAFRVLRARWSWIYVPGHLQYFRAKPFAEWVGKQGLDVETLQTWTQAPNLYFMLEEAFLLLLSDIMERGGGRVNKVGRTIRRFVYSRFHQQVVQMRLKTLYRLTPFLDGYFTKRLLGSS